MTRKTNINQTVLTNLVENKAKSYKDFKKIVEDNLAKGVKENPQYAEILSAMATPYNPTKGNKYRGINRLVLTMVSLAKGYTDPRWMTLKQMQDKGYSLKAKDPSKGYQKGDQKCVEIMYFIPKYFYELDKEGNIDWRHGRQISDSEYEKLTEEEKKRVFTKTIKSFVFNAEQIDGIAPLETAKKNYSTKLIDHIAKKLNVALKWNSGKERPCYSPKEDKVYMPSKDLFKKELYLKGAGLHELAHSTGHSSRLNRDLVGMFGTQSYAFEELIAESTAAMLCSFLGIEKTVDDNHKAYVKSWLSVIKDNPSALIDAFKLAEKACDYIIENAELENYTETVKETEEVTEPVKATEKKATKKSAKKTTKKATKKATEKVEKTAEVKKTTAVKVDKKAKKGIAKVNVIETTTFIRNGLEIVRIEKKQINGLTSFIELTKDFYDSISAKQKKTWGLA